MSKYIVSVIIIILMFGGVLSGGWSGNISDYFNSTSPSVGMSFLKIGMGARAVSLGGAYSPIVRDPTAVYWNPAAVIYTKGLDASFSHLSLMEDINYEFIAISTGDEKQGVGLGMGGLFYGGMELRDERPSVEPIGTFDAYSFFAKLSYGRRFGGDIIAGVSIGGVLERIYIYSTHTYTIDFGMLYYPQVIKPIVFSLNVNNLGPKVMYIDESFRLPLTTKLGCSYTQRIKKINLTVVTEVSKSIDTPLSSAFGVEAGFSFLSLRMGYSYNKKSVDRWAGGFGIKYKFLSLDYSFSPYLLDLGIKHCISSTLDF
ncbi:PorV/PorQ family protein [candidate division WOR-3 bacterium]|nr:PorV/PorQ family protein [candidate division WOR-3 bacterium]